MKKLLLTLTVCCATLAIIPTLFFSNCTTIEKGYTWLKSNDPYAMAFGNFLRSLEGAGYGPNQIPSLIMAARDKWLPAGAQWDKFAAGIIHDYVVANPNNPAEVNRVLEEFAMKLQTPR